MRYVIAKVNQRNEDLCYKVYITDCLSNLARVPERWYDFINGENEEQKRQEEAERAIQVLRDSFYGKEE